jgi:hypothetical protein
LNFKNLNQQHNFKKVVTVAHTKSYLGKTTKEDLCRFSLVPNTKLIIELKL